MKTKTAIGALCLMLLVQGCAMDGARRVTVIDENSTPVTGVVVLPLSTISAGIGVGAEGKGPRTASRTVVGQAFLFDSGQDLLHEPCREAISMLTSRLS